MNNNTQLTIASLIVAGGLIVASFMFNSGGGSNTKTFDVVMENNRYNPSTIEVSLGDEVIINFTNKDNVAHGIALREFNATVPNGHLPPRGKAQMRFIANQRLTQDAALCGGPNPTDKTDTHGEEFVVKVI